MIPWIWDLSAYVAIHTWQCLSSTIASSLPPTSDIGNIHDPYKIQTLLPILSFMKLDHKWLITQVNKVTKCHRVYSWATKQSQRHWKFSRSIVISTWRSSEFSFTYLHFRLLGEWGERLLCNMTTQHVQFFPIPSSNSNHLIWWH
jgi:hypothetical protein